MSNEGEKHEDEHTLLSSATGASLDEVVSLT